MTSSDENGLKILRGCFEGGTELYEYTYTCSADKRQTSFASYRYSHWNKCQKLINVNCLNLLVAKATPNPFKLRGCGMPTWDAYSSGHLVPSLWDLRMFYLLRPILFRTCRYFTGLCSSNIPRYFLDFAFILKSSHCFTTVLSVHITSARTAVKDHVIKNSETAFRNNNVNYFLVHKNSSEVIEKLRLRNFQGSQVSSLEFSTLYTWLPQDLIKAKVLSLVNWWFNRESKTYRCTYFRQSRLFLATRSMTRINVGLTLSYVKLSLSSWKTYMCNLKAWFIHK